MANAVAGGCAALAAWVAGGADEREREQRDAAASAVLHRVNVNDAGVLVVHGNWDLRELDCVRALPAPLCVTSDLCLYRLTALRELPAGLEVSGTVHVSGCPALRSVGAMQADSMVLDARGHGAGATQLTFVDPNAQFGSLELRGMQSDAFASGPCKFPRSVSVSRCPRATRLLPAQVECGTDFTLAECPDLVSLPERIVAGASILIHKLPQVSHIDSNIVGQTVSIASCPALRDLTGSITAHKKCSVSKCESLSCISASIAARKIELKLLPQIKQLPPYLAASRQPDEDQGLHINCISMGITTLPCDLKASVLSLSGCHDLVNWPATGPEVQDLWIANCRRLRGAFPPTVKVSRSLFLEDCSMSRLPYGMHLTGKLVIAGYTALEALPSNLLVDEEVIIDNIGVASSRLKRVPDNLCTPTLKVVHPPAHFAYIPSGWLGAQPPVESKLRDSTSVIDAPLKRRLEVVDSRLTSQAFAWLKRASPDFGIVEPWSNTGSLPPNKFRSLASACAFWAHASDHPLDSEPDVQALFRTCCGVGGATCECSSSPDAPTSPVLVLLDQLSLATPMFLSSGRVALATRVFEVCKSLARLTSAQLGWLNSLLSDCVVSLDHPMKALAELRLATKLVELPRPYTDTAVENLALVANQLERIQDLAGKHFARCTSAELTCLTLWMENVLNERLDLGLDVIDVSCFPCVVLEAMGNEQALVHFEEQLANDALSQVVEEQSGWLKVWRWFDMLSLNLQSTCPIKANPELSSTASTHAPGRNDAALAARVLHGWVTAAPSQQEKRQRAQAARAARGRCAIRDAASWATSHHPHSVQSDHDRSLLLGCGLTRYALNHPISNWAMAEQYAPLSAPDPSILSQDQPSRDVVVLYGGWDLSGLDLITTLPEGIHIEGDLNLRDCISLCALPTGLAVLGDVYLRGCLSLKNIADIRVGGAIGDAGYSYIELDDFKLRDEYAASCSAQRAIHQNARLNDVAFFGGGAFSSFPPHIHGHLALGALSGMNYIPTELEIGGKVLWYKLDVKNGCKRLQAEDIIIADCESPEPIMSHIECENVSLFECSARQGIARTITASGLVEIRGDHALEKLPIRIEASCLEISLCSSLEALRGEELIVGMLEIENCSFLGEISLSVPVGGLSISNCTEIVRLMSGLQVDGNLVLNGNGSRSLTLASLPNNLKLDGDLHLMNCPSLTSIPESFLSWPASADGKGHKILLDGVGISRAEVERLQASQGPHVRIRQHRRQRRHEQLRAVFSLSDILLFWETEFNQGRDIHETWPLGTEYIRLELLKNRRMTAWELRVLRRFLCALRHSEEMKQPTEARAQLASRVVHLLELLYSAEEDIVAALLQHMHNSMGACFDKPVWALNQMEIVVRTAQARNDTKALRRVGRGIMRLEVVHKHARKKIEQAESADDISVYLFFEINLREALELPVSATSMSHEALAHTSADELEAAKAEALAISPAALDAWLLAWPEWRRHLRAKAAKDWSWKGLQPVRAGFLAWLSSPCRWWSTHTTLFGERMTDPVQLHGAIWSFDDLLRHWVETGRDLHNMPLSEEDMRCAVLRFT